MMAIDGYLIALLKREKQFCQQTQHILLHQLFLVIVIIFTGHLSFGRHCLRVHENSHFLSEASNLIKTVSSLPQSHDFILGLFYFKYYYERKCPKENLQ